MAQGQESFGQIMKRLLEASGLTKDELSERLQESGCPADEGGAAPSVALLDGMMVVLKPSAEDEQAIFRTIAPMFILDSSKEFADLAQVCRKAMGFSLTQAGKKLEHMKIAGDGKYPYAVAVALMEMGSIMPSQAEGLAMAEIYQIPAGEYKVFTNKIVSTNQGGIRVVSDDFVPTHAPNEKVIAEAEARVKKEQDVHQEMIVSGAAQILAGLKNN